ncbi:hypothetical protein ACIF85_32145 [Streptomyces sp. NPDC086033]|uniref:hypothetical protein n=1 Tax=Streptomyces sp. NPDC086033 TaxID=3365747 RepID=UPI0037D582BA
MKRFDALRTADGKRRVMTNKLNRTGFLGKTAAAMTRLLSSRGSGERPQTGTNIARARPEEGTDRPRTHGERALRAPLLTIRQNTAWPESPVPKDQP